MTHHPSARLVAMLLLVAAAALTAILATRTFWYLFGSVTNVPYADQWVMLQEILRVRTGQTGWSYLWSPYWGQRALLPRLLDLLSVRYLGYSMMPFIVTNVAAQASMIVVVVSLAWRLFPDRRSSLFWLSTVAAVHLLLSSLQMEIFIEGSAAQHTIGYASAVASIAILAMALDPGSKLQPRLWISVLLGLISSACLAIGPFVFPILIFEAWLARAGIKCLAVLTAITGLVGTAYLVGYTRPQMGMGVAGLIHHPGKAFGVVALVLGGPVSLYSRWLGVVVGGIGIAVAGGLILHFLRIRSAKPAAIGMMMAVCFLIGSAGAIAIGRMSVAVLIDNGTQPLPSRYLAPTFVFWAMLFPVSLSGWNTGRIGRLAAIAVSAVIITLTFGTWNWQWRLSREWAMVSQDYDAIGSGFLVSVSDQEYMSRIIEDADFRSQMVDSMRQQHLSVFAEPRARWMDRNIKTIGATIRTMSGTMIGTPIRTTDEDRNCRATLTKAVPLGSDPPGFRVVGALTVDGVAPRRRLDILVTDNAGTVKGLARTLPARSENAPATDFLGYARGISPWVARLYVFLPNGRVCRAQMP